MKIRNNRTYPQFLELNGYPEIVAPVDYDEYNDGPRRLSEEAFIALSKFDRDRTLIPGGTNGHLELGLPCDKHIVSIRSEQATEAMIVEFVIYVLAEAARVPVPAVVEGVDCVVNSDNIGDLTTADSWDHFYDVFTGCLTVVLNALFDSPEARSPGKHYRNPPSRPEAKPEGASIIQSAAKPIRFAPELGDTIIRGTEQQYKATRGKPQLITAERKNVVAGVAWPEDKNLTKEVRDKALAIQKAAFAWDEDRGALDQEMSNGCFDRCIGGNLLFASGPAANTATPESYTEAEGEFTAESAYALGALIITVPIYRTCPETGRQALVYGDSSPDDPTYLPALRRQHDAETAAFMHAAGEIGRDYRACIGINGEWQSFAAKSDSTIAQAAEALKDHADPDNTCPESFDNPIVPASAHCVHVSPIDVNGVGPGDYLVQYDTGPDGGFQRLVIDDKKVFDIGPRRAGMSPMDDSDDSPLDLHDVDQFFEDSDSNYLAPMGDLTQGWSTQLPPIAKANFDRAYTSAATITEDVNWLGYTLTPRWQEQEIMVEYHGYPPDCADLNELFRYGWEQDALAAQGVTTKGQRERFFADEFRAHLTVMTLAFSDDESARRVAQTMPSRLSDCEKRFVNQNDIVVNEISAVESEAGIPRGIAWKSSPRASLGSGSSRAHTARGSIPSPSWKAAMSPSPFSICRPTRTRASRSTRETNHNC